LKENNELVVLFVVLLVESSEGLVVVVEDENPNPLKMDVDVPFVVVDSLFSGVTGVLSLLALLRSEKKVIGFAGVVSVFCVVVFVVVIVDVMRVEFSFVVFGVKKDEVVCCLTADEEAVDDVVALSDPNLNTGVVVVVVVEMLLATLLLFAKLGVVVSWNLVSLDGFDVEMNEISGDLTGDSGEILLFAVNFGVVEVVASACFEFRDDKLRDGIGAILKDMALFVVESPAPIAEPNLKPIDEMGMGVNEFTPVADKLGNCGVFEACLSLRLPLKVGVVVAGVVCFSVGT
jgi:hypothetical protein